jgi:asparagine synthase (glutamine-hydrolysing)
VRHDAEMSGSDPPILCLGRPRFRDPDLAKIANEQGAAAAWRTGFARWGPTVAANVDGDFAVGFRDAQRRTFLAVDRFSIHTLCYRAGDSGVEFAARADGFRGSSRALDPQAIFDYLYFHVIPAPRTIFKGVRRLPAGHYALHENGRLVVAKWWKPVFDEARSESFEALRIEFRRLLSEAVRRQLDGSAVGCFLSGGTDSSTIAGILGTVSGKPAQTFSIGFDAHGYDEMQYARLAARHFNTDHHEYYVTPDDLVREMPAVARFYDQPFGNSSVLPALLCARMAKAAGVERLLAGDGGDELFGGNTRYAKQRVFALYDRVPRRLRNGLVEPALLGLPALARLPGIRKAASYVEQARVAMPDRMQMYNLIMRLGLREVLDADFAASIDPEDPLRAQRDVYGAADARTLVNRMLAFDWKYTLADSDLPKVLGAAAIAGIGVGFPMLDDALVDFSLRLEPEHKLRGLKLRWFFKEALRDHLPAPIIDKKKHGFGLPFGQWVIQHAALKRLVIDALDSLSHRRIVRSEFVDQLANRYLPQAPGYYGEMVWILVVLEHWLQGASITGEAR